ncbi:MULTISPECIES: ABC transporter permease [unclassified Butyrivibrio]|uniref:ABC transporter permease n=1 Tax=unclassified Butyrivibrio TaxID=2639466 RepID=UPI0003B35206|nr:MULTISPECIES: ABC transporter permease [unclassified Butyrivibrio]MBO6197568.1 ABC transporter permease [Butyrivibrio sp.]
MKKFIIRRLLISVVLLFFVSMIIYTIMRLMPTSYVETQAMTLAQRPGSKSFQEWVDQLNAQYGLDTGIVQGYFRWLSKAIRLDFGDSWYFNQPVLQKFSSVIWYSFGLGLAAFIIEILIAIPAGIVAARKQYSIADYAITVIALIGISLPSFFFATILKYVFSIRLGWVDLYGIVSRMHETMSDAGKVLDMVKHMVLPTLTLVVVSIGSLMRYTRANMLEVLNSDYIRTARAKGLPENKVINHHAFRNTLIPIVTLLGGSLPGLFGGAMITETLYQIPGIGYTFYQCVTQGDIPFVMFYMVFMAVLILLGNLIADITYALVDPRVRVN